MKIALIEAFYSGSHKAWADSYKKFSEHCITIFSLPGRHWKWRMHGASISLAKQLNEISESFDLLLCTDMIDLPLFKSLLKDNLNKLPIVLYMHENQLTYPWSPDDQDLKLQRDNHYAFTNYTSCLVAHTVLFNSDYHRSSFLGELPKFLKMFPDENNLETIDVIKEKASTLYLGLELKNQSGVRTKGNAIRILWNHRWEYDKNPDGFLTLLNSLENRKLEFELVLLGERYTKMPDAYYYILDKYSNRISHNAYAESKEQYWDLLSSCDVLPVTSIQDFFGISIVEAISAGVVPVLPNRLAYPEYVDQENLYTNDEELVDKVINFQDLPIPDVSRFSWQYMARKYDEFCEHFIMPSSSPRQ